MKTIFTTMATVAVALICFLSPTTSSAQGPLPCTPGCDSIPWSPQLRTLLQINSNCWVRVNYSYRSGCGYDDVTITSIEMFGTACAGLNANTLLEVALLKLIRQNPMGWTLPEQDSCIYGQFRFVKAACWENLWDSAYVPCDSVGCCLSELIVCRDTGIQVYEDLEILLQPCDSTVMMHCEEVCGEGPSSSKSDSPDLGHIHLDSAIRGVRPSSPDEPLGATTIERSFLAGERSR